MKKALLPLALLALLQACNLPDPKLLPPSLVDTGAAGFEGTWVSPPESSKTQEVRRGLQLLSETYKYLGLGSQSKLNLTGNKLACTNCHLEEGRAAFAGPWAVVYEKYADPGIFSSRTNEFRNIPIRVNGCIQRSMVSINAQQLDATGPEMAAITAYFQWLSTGRVTAKAPSHTDVIGQGFKSVPDMTRAADPVRGEQIYQTECLPCHGENGEGIWNEQDEQFVYPALWGPDSFANGAGMNRIRTGVRFVRFNMPYGEANALDETTLLTVDEAWDVMGYVVSRPRPQFQNHATDWSGVGGDGVPNWAKKRIDASYPVYYPRMDTDGTPDYTGDTTLPPYYPPEKHLLGPFQDMAELQDLIRCTNWGQRCN